LNLLDAGGGPPGWMTQLSESLLALDCGKVTPIVSPLRTRKKGDSFTLAKLRWLAVQNVYILWGKNNKKLWAQAEVARRINVDKDTLKKWEQEILRLDTKRRKTLQVVKFMAPFFDDDLHPEYESQFFYAAFKKFGKELNNVRFYDLRHFPLEKIKTELKRAGFRTKTGK
jgi:DNA-binding XRE family transcriptional regulator